MAGMPIGIIRSAQKILKKLENSHGDKKINLNKNDSKMQLSFFNLDDPKLEELKEDLLSLNTDELTPIEALIKLNEIKRILKRITNTIIRLYYLFIFNFYFTFAIHFCESSSGVEHHLAKVRVAGSNPVFRSEKILLEWWNW